MNGLPKWARLASVAALVVLGAVGCSSASTSSSAVSAAGDAAGGACASNTVSVNVGLVKPICLRKGKLNVGLFMHAETNAYQQEIVAGARAQAARYGWNLTVFQANYDMTTQIDQLQEAAVNKQFDALGVVVIDGDPECNVLTKTLPAADTLVVNVSSPICGRELAAGNNVWAPGTYSYNDRGNTVEAYTLWLKSTVAAFPGPQNVVFVGGPENNSGTRNEKAILDNLVQQDPNFKIKGWLYTDWTTATAQQMTQTYLQGHPDTTVVISAYSPDLTRGVVNAVDALGMQHKLKISDYGASSYTEPLIKSGLIKMSFPYYPYAMGENLMISIKAAQDNQQPPLRVRSEFPRGGPLVPSDMITDANVDMYKPQY